MNGRDEYGKIRQSVLWNQTEPELAARASEVKEPAVLVRQYKLRGFMYLKSIKSLLRVAGLTVFGLAVAAAQTQDISGNSLLKGSFRFRHVAIQNVDQNNNPTEITATYGTITFDGAGHYTITATSVDNTVSGGAPQPLNLTATYAIGSNGTGYLTNEIY